MRIRDRQRILAAALFMWTVLAAAADGPRVVLGDPFNSLPWLRADLTGEKVTEPSDSLSL